MTMKPRHIRSSLFHVHVHTTLPHVYFEYPATSGLFCKAGRLVGLADCYAAIVLADNATFLLAVNRIAAFRSQLVEHQPLNVEVVGLSPTKDKIFPHVCSHFGIHGQCGIILPRLLLRGQLQNHTALLFCMNYQIKDTVFFYYSETGKL